jgi:transposase
MAVMFTHGAGRDGHKKTVMACRVPPDPTGAHADGIMELQACGAMTVDLLALSDWLAAAGVTPVAIESTGEYWKPLYHLLEGELTVFLVNAAHVKQVPGRQTEKADARWLAQLMRDGLLRASFIPPVEPRDWRDLTRYRTTVVQEHSREVHRVQGVLERANLKLASVATDLMGVSARAILAALVEGRADPAAMAELAKWRMRSKMPLLEQALTGLVRDHHRQWLAMPLAHIDFLDEPIEALSAEITRRLAALSADAPSVESPGATGGAERAATPDAADASMTFARAVTLLDTIPGVNQRGGELLVAEWGIDMGRFGTAARLAAWSGVAPGNDESAGKQRSGKTRPGNQAVRTGLTPLAHAAARTKGTYVPALDHRLAARRGKKRAIIAVAHSIVVSAFHRLIRDEPYRELGAHDFDDRRQVHLVDQLTRRIERLGYRVTLEPVAAA